MGAEVKIRKTVLWKNYSDYPYKSAVETLTAAIAKTLEASVGQCSGITKGEKTMNEKINSQ